MPGCPVIVRDGPRCARHPYEDKRESASERGYGPKWKLVSAAFLKAHPWCQWPGCSAPSKVADHIVPRRLLVAAGDPHPDAWDRLQALCQTHHNRKTASERRAR
jgi:5-methylcytosine-specific restriction protein A